MRKLIMTSLLMLFGVSGYGQLKTDPLSIFKMILFLDKPNNHFKGMDVTVVKGDSLYSAFSDAVQLKLHKLNRVISNVDYEESGSNYDFFELLIYDKANGKYTDNVSYKRNLNFNEEQFFGVPVGNCDSYVIAINRFTGIAYRLKGFNTNDFLTFLNDFINEYNLNKRNTLNIKKFLHNIKVDRLDFQCLYDGLTSKNFTRNEFPCLQRMSNIIPVN